MVKTRTLGDRIIERAHAGYHTRLTTGPKDYPPYSALPWIDRARWSKYIKTIADEIELEIAAELLAEVKRFQK